MLKHAMKMHGEVIKELKLLPRFLGNEWGSVMAQEFEGNVTLLPPLRFSDYWLLLSSPDLADLVRFIKSGRLMVWPKASLLSVRFKLVTCSCKGYVSQYFLL